MGLNLPADLPPELIDAARAHERARDLAKQNLARGEDALEICGVLSDAADAWILAVWRASTSQRLQDHATILALGGYGRRELSFGSDLDLLIEVHDPDLLDDPRTEEDIERWMRDCRTARVKLSHAVRSPAQGEQELARDWRTPVSLLDARELLCGEEVDREQSIGREAALAALRKERDGAHFVDLLVQGFRARRERHGKTVYLLEPDVKSGLGGLRDVQAVHWASMVRCGASALTQSLPEWGFEEIHRDQLLHASRWLHTVRHHLHLSKGRKSDRLLFPEQEALARTLFPTHKRPVESLMSEHYARTRQVGRLMERNLRRLLRERERDLMPILNHADFMRTDEELVYTGEVPLRPVEVMDAIALAEAQDLLLDAKLEQAMASAIARWGEEELYDRALQQALIALLGSPGQDGMTGSRLIELGVLEKLVPEFSPLVCHVQHDVYHVYTTDVHTMYCVDRARSLVHELPDPICDRWPVFRQIAAEVKRDDLLVLACFLHDIGKRRGGDHSRKGAAMVPEICARMGLEADDVEVLATLVREHLLLSNTSRRRDLSDPRVARDLCARIPSLDLLNLLTVLTFCDMSTVGPESMNDWRAMLLLQLHRRLSHALLEGGEGDWEDRKLLIAERREQLLAALSPTRNPSAYHALDRPDPRTLRESVNAFLLDLPLAHLASAEPAILGRQLIVYMQAIQSARAALLSHALPGTRVTEIVIAKHDAPGTLAKIAGVLSAQSVNILTASIVTTSSGLVLDVFRVEAPTSHHDTPIAPERLARLEETLRSVLDGEQDVEELLIKRIAESRLSPRPGPEVNALVRSYQDASDHFTVIELQAPDRLGLLYEIATTLNRHDISTHFSTLDGMGNKVVDTFYVEHIIGGKLSEEQVTKIEEALLDTIMHSPFLDHPSAG